jgi:hypothetical protein
MKSEAEVSRLVHKSKESYGDDFQKHLLEQYKIVRTRIVDIVSDRTTQNRFLLTVLTALIAVPVFVLRTAAEISSVTLQLTIILIAFPVVGAIISWQWIRWNKTYWQALAAGYRLLKEIEVQLPAQPFTLENLYRKEAGGGHHKTTTEFHVLMGGSFWSAT